MTPLARIAPIIAVTTLWACGASAPAATPTGSARSACEQQCDTQERACTSGCSPKSDAIDTCSERCDTDHASCLADCR